MVDCTCLLKPSDVGFFVFNLGASVASTQVMLIFLCLRDAGVIGNARAAELYGLNILECNFQVVKTFCMLYIKFIVFPTDEVHNNGYFCCD
jgi:hypothetical protein